MNESSIAVTEIARQDVRSSDWFGAVTVGEETARRLSKILGRDVLAGEVFDLGLIASTDNPDAVGEHVFSDPRLNPNLYPDF